MTRFELAAVLSKGLCLLEEEEKRRVIDMYIADINRRIEAGENEEAVVAKLGDINVLTENILKSYHIRMPENKPEEEAVKQQEATPRADGFTENSTDKNRAEFEKMKRKFFPVKEKKEEIEDINKGKEPGMLRKALAGLWNITTDFTFNLVNLFVFIFIWLPCMAITAAGVVCTATVTMIMVLSGIGFWGICIAGVGCCIVGISFCGWLGNAMGGKKHGKAD